MIESSVRSTEVLAFASGKGGTGKTSLIAALGYALTFSGHKVLMIDTDRATDGFSLFILGPEGMNQLGDYLPQNTFAGILDRFQEEKLIDVRPRIVHRLDPADHGMSYEAIISGRNLYGDFEESLSQGYAARQIDRKTFQGAIRALFKHLCELHLYDYILVDTRGGFSFESTDLAAVADSFIIVTEATYTNFYQDRNLVDRISEVAVQMQTKAMLRGVIVNKATEGAETGFRQSLTTEFGLRFEDTWPVSLDLHATSAYKTQKVIYREAPSSRFAYDSLQAFRKILRIVTSQWPEQRVIRWNELVLKVDSAIAEHNQQVEIQKKREMERLERFAASEVEREKIQLELASSKDALAQEKRRQDILLEELKAQARVRVEALERDDAHNKERREWERAARDREFQQLAEESRKLQDALAKAREIDEVRQRELSSMERASLQFKYRSRLLLMISAFLLLFALSTAVFLSKNLMDNNRRLQAELKSEDLLQSKLQAAQEALGKTHAIQQPPPPQSPPATLPNAAPTEMPAAAPTEMPVAAPTWTPEAPKTPGVLTNQASKDRSVITVEFYSRPLEREKIEPVLHALNFNVVMKPSNTKGVPINTVTYGSTVPSEDVSQLVRELKIAGVDIHVVRPIKGPRKDEALIQLDGYYNSMAAPTSTPKER